MSHNFVFSIVVPPYNKNRGLTLRIKTINLTYPMIPSVLFLILSSILWPALHKNDRLLCFLPSILWHPSGETTEMIVLSDTHLLLYDVGESGSISKVNMITELFAMKRTSVN